VQTLVQLVVSTGNQRIERKQKPAGAAAPLDMKQPMQAVKRSYTRLAVGKESKAQNKLRSLEAPQQLHMESRQKITIL